jgi:hypothetical protein
MNLVPIGTYEFFPSSYVSLQTKGTGSPTRTANRNWGDAIKTECPLSSSFPLRRDPFPPVFVMETAENCASHDLAVSGEGMSVVTLQR